jgi:hypothetical protein
VQRSHFESSGDFLWQTGDRLGREGSAKEEGTESLSARSLVAPLGASSCFSASSQVPAIRSVC